jgi:hypothetical protein
VELSVDQPTTAAAKSGSCPLASSTGVSQVTVAAACNEDSRFVARVVDSRGRRFVGVSSLRFHWLANAPQVSGVGLAVPSGSQGDDLMESGLARNTLIASGKPGLVEVQVLVEGQRQRTN